MKAWKYDDACRIAGQLYGNLLARASDEAGFQHAVEHLTEGRPLRRLVYEFAVSDEFREKFVMNQTANELAKRLIVRFWKNARPDPRAIKELAVDILEGDWREAISRVIEDERYTKAHGEDRVPLWA